MVRTTCIAQAKSICKSFLESILPAKMKESTGPWGQRETAAMSAPESLIREQNGWFVEKGIAVPSNRS